MAAAKSTPPIQGVMPAIPEGTEAPPVTDANGWTDYGASGGTSVVVSQTAEDGSEESQDISVTEAVSMAVESVTNDWRSGHNVTELGKHWAECVIHGQQNDQGQGRRGID